jgi:hypothetical protein
LTVLFLSTSCHKTDTNSSAFKKPENGSDPANQKNSKIARNTFNPGNPRPSNPNAAKEKLLAPDATNSKPQKLHNSSTNANPGNSKTKISKPGKLKTAPRKKKNKRFMS